MCSLVRFCSSMHCRPGFKLCPRKLHSFFVQLLPDFVHMQLLQSSIQFSPISLGVPSPSRHCESAPVLKPDISKGRSKLQSIFVQLLPDSVHMQLLQSSIQLSPTSLAVPLLSTQATAFSPNLPGEEATNAPVSSSSSSWRTWQMTSPLSQEQSLWFPLTSTPEDLSSSSHASSHSSHISRCCLRLPCSSTHSCSSLLTQSLKVQTGTPVEVHLQLLHSSFQESPTSLGFPSLSSPHWADEVEATFTTLSVQEGEPWCRCTPSSPPQSSPPRSCPLSRSCPPPRTRGRCRSSSCTQGLCLAGSGSCCSHRGSKSPRPAEPLHLGSTRTLLIQKTGVLL